MGEVIYWGWRGEERRGEAALYWNSGLPAGVMLIFFEMEMEMD